MTTLTGKFLKIEIQYEYYMNIVLYEHRTI